MQSGVLADDESNYLEMALTGPGTLTFDWKVYCKPSEEMVFEIIDSGDTVVEQTEFDERHSSYRTHSADITGTDTYTIKWSSLREGTYDPNDPSSINSYVKVNHIAWYPDTPTVPTAPWGSYTGAYAEIHEPIHLTAQATNLQGDTLTYTYDWGDGQLSTSAATTSGDTVTMDHRWFSPGVYQVRVKASNGTHELGPARQSLTVSPSHLQAVFGRSSIAKSSICLGRLPVSLNRSRPNPT